MVYEKKLIINADDFGVSQGINNGIMDCYKKKALTDISMLANGDAFMHAVSLAKGAGIKNIGLHLVATGGFKALNSSGHVKSLVSKEGVFENGFLSLIFGVILGKINIKELEMEFEEQVKRVRGAGFVISHIDAHEHIHMYPAILKIVIKIMKKENIRYLRYPVEKIGMMDLIREPYNALRHFALVTACVFSKKILVLSGIKYNNFFIGQFHAHKLKEKDFLKGIQYIGNGVTEIGCHPGYFGAEISKTRPWYKYCEDEVKALCSEVVKKEIANKGIKLVSWDKV